MGANLGEREANIEEASLFITFNMGDITGKSSIYESSAWGMENSPEFLNQVLKISTKLSPKELISEIAELEVFFGRERSPSKYLDREMDVDILFYDDEIIDGEKIQVPHPRLHLRRFVLEPMAELAPEMIHPVIKKTMQQLLNECEDKNEVRKK
ncbi:MAG: 2-amino-4-hydroxy-6-hydroxymethyldihydropteridine diphosphokinase [Crocinitomicaceae bacterium]|nr:2-amino-4-hydroxy-6-hydroxymethyldihydropteridine diphosphokinase [Crocinitomicaceae bacterium]